MDTALHGFPCLHGLEASPGGAAAWTSGDRSSVPACHQPHPQSGPFPLGTSPASSVKWVHRSKLLPRGVRMPRLSHARLPNWAPCPFHGRGVGLGVQTPSLRQANPLASGAGAGNLWYSGIKGSEQEGLGPNPTSTCYQLGFTQTSWALVSPKWPVSWVAGT